MINFNESVMVACCILGLVLLAYVVLGTCH